MILDKEETLKRKTEILSDIKAGKIFIYPTDTIYGLGCNAALEDSVEKIRHLKSRPDKPLSVIAPGKDWILEYCDVPSGSLNKLPGPFTIILKLRRKAVSHSVNMGQKSIGVRIPDHWFTELIVEAGVPFVTTSVNIAGQPHMTDLNDLDESIKNGADWIIFEGKKTRSPSTLFVEDRLIHR